MGGEEFEELGGGAFETEGGLLWVVGCGFEHVEGFGEQGGVVGVLGGAGDAVVFDSGFPEVGAGVANRDGAAD